jgi:hypothetical protein
MGKTIRVSDEFHGWITAHSRDDETMEETLRRLTRGPDPETVAGLLSEAEAERAKGAVRDLRDRDADRTEQAAETFADDS